MSTKQKLAIALIVLGGFSSVFLPVAVGIVLVVVGVLLYMPLGAGARPNSLKPSRSKS